MKIQFHEALLRWLRQLSTTRYSRFTSVPSGMTPRLAIDIARNDILEQLAASDRRLKHLQREARQEQERKNELLEAEERMSLWLYQNPE